ncbi:hypothetical protein F4780DRAFT_784350 [Xylariomycetidae sp. FL0641]|nr:hypothetical protein F4780DRAFT_784350 [Xylariomycetidae sp. FL0641]
MPPSHAQTKKTLAEGGGVLLLATQRSGTRSVTAALEALGYTAVLHGAEDQTNARWAGIARAAYATFPYLSQVQQQQAGPSPPPPPPLPFSPSDQKPFNRADWDALLGHYQVVSDFAVFFAPQLLEIYPGAAVVLWERDPAAWERSFDVSLIRAMHGSAGARFMRDYVAPAAGVWFWPISWHLLTGWLRAADPDGWRAHLQARRAEHYAAVRRLARPDRLLEFRLADGWAPLCAFLGVDEVPRAPFPHRNDGAELAGILRKAYVGLAVLAVWNTLKYPLMLGVGVAAAVGFAGSDGRSVASRWW